MVVMVDDFSSGFLAFWLRWWWTILALAVGFVDFGYEFCGLMVGCHV